MNAEDALGKMNPTFQCRETLAVRFSGNLDPIGAGDLVTRVDQPMGQVTVIGDQQQALTVFVESAHGEQTWTPGGKEVDDPFSSTGIVIRTEIAMRLVQQEVLFSFDTNRFTIESDALLSRCHSDTQLIDGLSIDSHPAGQDELFAGPS